MTHSFPTLRSSDLQTITFEHASGWTWGDMFLFVDNKWYNGISGSDGHTYYGEFSPRLSLGKISGADLSFGPIKDVLISATYERGEGRSEEHTSELQSLMRISYAVFCLKKKK